MHKLRLAPPFPSLLITVLSLILQTGCATFIGSDRPVEEKSKSYQVADLSRLNADWKRESEENPEKNSNPSGNEENPGAESALADRSWSSSRTGSMITLNTICRPSHASLAHNAETLRDLSRQLFLGMGDIRMSEETEIRIQGEPALMRTVEGSIQESPGKVRTVRMRTVNLLHGTCLFDILLVATPSQFPSDEGALQKLLDSLRLPAAENP
jgi:hypothetical protein